MLQPMNERPSRPDFRLTQRRRRKGKKRALTSKATFAYSKTKPFHASTPPPSFVMQINKRLGVILNSFLPANGRLKSLFGCFRIKRSFILKNAPSKLESSHETSMQMSMQFTEMKSLCFVAHSFTQDSPIVISLVRKKEGRGEVILVTKKD